MVTATRRMTLDEFLALPEEKPYREFVRGEVIEKAMGHQQHSDTVIELIMQLGSFGELDSVAELFTQVQHAARGDEDRVYLPDVSVTLKSRFRADRTHGPVEVPPDIAIEVLPPDVRAAMVLDKVDFYVRTGVPITWAIDPEAQTLTEYRPGIAPRQFRAPEKVSAEPVLPGFALDLEALFAES